MRTLIKTLTTGGFIAPRVYVHPGVWFDQSGAKVEHLSTKCAAFFVFLEGLQEVKGSVSGMGSVLPLSTSLAEFANKVAAIQCLLADKISTIDRASVDEGCLKAVKKSMDRDTGAPAIDVCKYAQAVNNLLKESLIFEKWLDIAHDSSPQLHQLVRFLQQVILPIVVSDLRVLLLRYIHKYANQVTSKE